MKRALVFLLCCEMLISCGERIKKNNANEEVLGSSDLKGDMLAVKHCVECHAFPVPELLPKSIWKEEVLPSMGYRMGIYEGEHQPDSLFEPGIGGQIVRKANVFPENPVLAKDDWRKIMDYYLQNAPDTIPPRIREKDIQIGLKHFKYKETSFSHQPPLTIMVKILPQNRGFAYGDGKRNISSLNFLTKELEKDYMVYLKTTPVNYYMKQDTIYLATIGTKMYPHDAPNGALQKLYSDGPGTPFKYAKLIIPNLQRPVFMEYEDLNSDGLEDVVVCEYGHLTGKLVWYENMGNDTYQMRPLRPEPGASVVVIKDIDQDGHPDIFALMAQGDEGIFLYKNRGNGTFDEQRILSFIPLYGSQYFDLVDFNNDGLDDIIYVCGDNADLSTILKSYHGIYVYLNLGDYRFKEAFFYHLNGAYKAVARDFDLDGDLDIAAISFFPDYKRYPEESFVYLENIGVFEYKEYSFPEVTRGRWIVMDAEDMDADGDIDLALGSFVDFYPEGDTTGLQEMWLNEGPSMIVLENTTIN
ncbi:MAG: VCBS repeat-containing protein [Cyclobacteriaceae bacterium]|nr:VCBS repeat-containing protein [Cyclobacteriaceae bacterium]